MHCGKMYMPPSFLLWSIEKPCDILHEKNVLYQFNIRGAINVSRYLWRGNCASVRGLLIMYRIYTKWNMNFVMTWFPAPFSCWFFQPDYTHSKAVSEHLKVETEFNVLDSEGTLSYCSGNAIFMFFYKEVEFPSKARTQATEYISDRGIFMYPLFLMRPGKKMIHYACSAS